MTEKIDFQTQKELLSLTSIQEKTCTSLTIISIVFVIISLIFLTLGSLPVNIILFSGAFSIIGLYLMAIGISIFFLSLAYLIFSTPIFPDQNLNTLSSIHP